MLPFEALYLKETSVYEKKEMRKTKRSESGVLRQLQLRDGLTDEQRNHIYQTRITKDQLIQAWRAPAGIPVVAAPAVRARGRGGRGRGRRARGAGH